MLIEIDDVYVRQAADLIMIHKKTGDEVDEMVLPDPIPPELLAQAVSFINYALGVMGENDDLYNAFDDWADKTL